MKNTIQSILSLFILLLSVSVYAQTTPVPTPPPTPKPGTPTTPATPSTQPPTNKTPMVWSQPDLTNQMTAFTKSWQDAYNKGDNAALKAMYANDVMMVNSDGTTTRMTRDQIGENFSTDFGKYKTQTEVKYGNAVLQPDGTVRLTGTYTTTHLDNKTGVKKTETGNYDHILVNKDGTWQFTQTRLTPEMK